MRGHAAVWQAASVDAPAVMEFARTQIRDSSDARAALQAIVDRCAGEAPDPCWDTIGRIDFDAAWRAEEGWFEELLASEPPAREINGLWFGIFNPVYDEGPVSDFYAAGSSHFGADPEWMCQLDWWPEARYAHSEAQAEIYQQGSAGSADAAYLADYVMTFAHASLAIQRLLLQPREALTQLARTHGQVAVAVGHDSGDAVLLGTLRTNGLERGDCAWI